MNEGILNNLPLIAIITPIAIAFVIGLFKNKYMNLKKAFVIVALSVSVIAIALMVKPVMFAPAFFSAMTACIILPT